MIKRLAIRLAAITTILACLALADAISRNDARRLLDWRTWAIAGVVLVVGMLPGLSPGSGARGPSLARREKARPPGW